MTMDQLVDCQIINNGSEMGDSNCAENRQVLIVLGGGFAGAKIARKLGDVFRVVLIDNKDFFENTLLIPSVTCITNLMDTGDMVKRLSTPHQSYLGSNVEFIKDYAEDVIDGKVIGREGTYPFDYLVIATGSSYPSDIKYDPINSIGDSHGLRLEHLSRMGTEIEECESIAVLGAGPVGIEIASEIKVNYPNKRIILVHRPDRVLNRLNKSASKHVEKWLRKHDIELYTSSTGEETEEGLVITSANGKETIMEVDRVIYCVGSVPNTLFMRNNFSHVLDNAMIKVNSFLQVEGCDNIFASSDCNNTLEEKMAYRANIHAEHIISNLKRLARGKVMKKKYKPKSYATIMNITLGPKDGIVTYNGKINLTGNLAIKAKKVIFKLVNQYAIGKSTKSIKTEVDNSDESEINPDLLLAGYHEDIIMKDIARSTDMFYYQARILIPRITKEWKQYINKYSLDSIDYPESDRQAKKSLNSIEKALYILSPEKLYSSQAELQQYLDFLRKSDHKIHVLLLVPLARNLERGNELSDILLDCEEMFVDFAHEKDWVFTIIRYTMTFEQFSLVCENHLHERTITVPFKEDDAIAYISKIDVRDSVLFHLQDDSCESQTITITGKEALSPQNIIHYLSEAGEFDINIEYAKDISDHFKNLEIRPGSKRVFRKLLLDCTENIVGDPTDESELKYRTHVMFQDWVSYSMHLFYK
eukprot:TRINITY_DN8999_c0_g1_i1.p1 TRINITY_DN8999_c0_g1~~TRINITY_DN8999_c0_g1_i1.p1  ORF type:complete len:713 (-),score=136.48 TRINITY_DN8999_c0_g1_i1:12-2114(-)